MSRPYEVINRGTKQPPNPPPAPQGRKTPPPPPDTVPRTMPVPKIIEVDGTVFLQQSLDRCHELLDQMVVPRRDDAGELLPLRWRLVALKAERERVS